MKVALVHDYLKEPGGAEEVLSVLHEMWPEAPIYTAYVFPEFWGRHKLKMEVWDIRQSWGRHLPFLPKLLSHYTILSPLFFSTMDLSEYDLVIVSQIGGYFPNGIKIGPKTKLITYCHTPPRFLYGYDTATRERYKWYWRPISAIASHILRMVDYRFAQKPDMFIANSKNVANRIKKFYRREAEVVYPPVEIKTPGSNDTRKGNYFLMVSRIVGSKNIELAVEAANKYKFKLKVAGRPIGRSGAEILKMIKGQQTEYLNEVSEEEKIHLMTKAKAFLALAKDEDFGITPVEAQLCGTPVIAFNGGGYRESVIDGKTGVLFEDISIDGLNEAIKKFNKMKWEKKEIIKNAESFSKKIFKERMLSLVNKYAGVTRD